MTQIVYGLASDNGDGSSSIRWFKNKNIVDDLLENDHETYGCNEGCVSEQLTFPAELDLKACGFCFSDSDYE